jgi:hypothetical protein
MMNWLDGQRWPRGPTPTADVLGGEGIRTRNQEVLSTLEIPKMPPIMTSQKSQEPQEIDEDDLKDPE